jgi:hypothetical protein
MEKIIEKLPLEVIRENIIPFTYELQPKELLEDIVSYYEVKYLLYDFYKCKFHDWVETLIPFGSSEKKIQEFNLRYFEEEKKYIKNLLYDDIKDFTTTDIDYTDDLVCFCYRLFYYSENGQYKKIFDEERRLDFIHYGEDPDDDGWTYDDDRKQQAQYIIDYTDNPLVFLGLLKQQERIKLLKYIANEAKKDDRHQYQPFLSQYLRDIYDYIEKNKL